MSGCLRFINRAKQPLHSASFDQVRIDTGPYLQIQVIMHSTSHHVFPILQSF